MTEDYILQLKNDGYLEKVNLDGKEILHLTTPCKFIFKQLIIKELKEKYIKDEEIGGVFWVNPSIINKEKTYIITKVSFIRNAIEDNLNIDSQGNKRTRKDTYRFDETEKNEAIEQICLNKQLPIKFHTHPTNGQDIIQQLTYQQLQAETSEQDKLESENLDIIYNYNLLMPRGLIISNKELGDDIFIGLYNGFISPKYFDESKKAIQQDNFNKLNKTVTKKIASWNLSNNETIIFGVVAVIILGYLLYKTKKYSIPVMVSLASIAPLLLTNTSNIDQPNYFNRLSSGDAEIYIPKWTDDINFSSQ